MARMTGMEIAERTLAGETPEAPCIVGDWVFHPKFYRVVTGRSIGEDPTRVAIEAFKRVGANLTPQFAIPTTDDYHPYPTSRSSELCTAEDLRDEIERLAAPDTLARDFDIRAAADQYAHPILQFRDIAGDDILRIAHFGLPNFMGSYGRWGYQPFFEALALYPDHMRRWFEHTGEHARLLNLAVVEAILKHSLAPFAYNGDDICFNDGPMCSVEALRQMYFPALRNAIQPLHDAGIRMIWHSDGNILPILDDLLGAGLWGFQGFQEETGPTLAIMAAQRTIWGTRPVLWGSVSVTSTLPYGTEADVRADVDRCFETCADGGFVLAHSSSIMPEVPVQNILAMYDQAAKR